VDAARTSAATQSLSDTQRLKKFESTRTNALRPIVFAPNGSFRALKENGKLAVGADEADVYKGRSKNPLANTAYHLPGYTGFGASPAPCPGCCTPIALSD
jgi:hypothetical protein